MNAMAKRPTIVMILILANMNSASPYIWMAKIFEQTTRKMLIVIHTATLMCSAPFH